MSDFSDYQILDVRNVPLSGVNLVEANAGTGKTYSIVSLYIRLLLEASMTVDHILVVSFTEAATAELRERVRRQLRRLQVVFATGSGTEEELQWLQVCPDREKSLRQIVRALQSFDQAAIYTIHGFCQRVLSDSAFEAGLSQATELITDDIAIRRQLISDFWHAETSKGTRLWVQYLLDKATPDTLYNQLSKYFSRPLINRLSPAEVDDSDDLERAFAGLFRQMQQDWPGSRKEIAGLLASDDSGLKRNIYKPASLPDLLNLADDWVAAGGVSLKGLTDLARLGSEKINASVKKNCSPPGHRVFELMQRLLDLGQQLESNFASRLASMRRRLIEYAERELASRKKILRVWHFDDLLGEVYRVLQSAHADSLRHAVGQHYSAALIDEFQDTDPLQFAIFDSLFCRDATPVFFVGDPKQAIYAFRGADVFAYLDARDRAAHCYRLESNYRSTPALVDSINSLFQQRENPFVIDAIGFHPSAAADDKSGLIIDGKVQPALRWWLVPDVEVDASNAADINRRIAASVATEIASLLQLIHERRVMKPEKELLEAGDIAVLVNSHAQGRMVRDALEQRGVACMQRTDENVFQSREADELWRVLRAIVEPSRYPLVRAALATELLGYDAWQIDILDQADSQWQELLDRFAAYPDTWRQHGFARMYRRMMQDFEVERRLLGLTDGQRRLTNLSHLADLLQQHSSQWPGRLDEVLIWMREQEKIEHPSDQAMLLRLESDENLVSIMTVHFSKGLQFPVVFCPYLWTAFSNSRSALHEFHDDQNCPTVDLLSEKGSSHKGQVAVESLAERVRLAYVALTRAKLACWAVWGPMKGSAQSSLNWLLCSSSAASASAVADIEQMKIPTAGEIASCLESVSTAAMTVEQLPVPENRRVEVQRAGVASLKPRVMQRDVPRGWRVSSFSAMTRHAAEEPRDYDAGKSEDRPVAAEPEGIFAFPRGARAGRCMHALLENIAFNDSRARIDDVAQRVLANHGFAAELASVLTDMARNVLGTQLSEAAPAWLCDVTPDKRIVEMEFYFPIAGIDASALRQTLGAFGNGTPIERRLAQLDFRVRGGFMHGFIDLVFEANSRFYVVDYKSNWLGNESSDYHVERLQREISKHDYYLQYLIYCVALHRHLTQKFPGYDYEQNFGGAYYLFLRGMHPDNGPAYGVFHDRPDQALMQRLDALFGQKGVVH